MWVQSLGWEDPLEEGIATHSSILAWKILGQRSLEDCSSQGCKESDMTEKTQQAYKHETLLTSTNVDSYISLIQTTKSQVAM